MLTDDESFEASVKDVKWIVAIIKEKTYRSPDNSKLLFMTKFDFSIFNDLMRYESYDNPQILEQFINHVIKDLYDDNENLKMTSKQMENKYFDGNFNTNPSIKVYAHQIHS